jgi:hypothetical protein
VDQAEGGQGGGAHFGQPIINDKRPGAMPGLLPYFTCCLV